MVPGRRKYNLDSIKEEDIPNYVDKRVRNMKYKLKKLYKLYHEIKSELMDSFNTSFLYKLLESNNLTLTNKILNDWLINYNPSTKDLITKAKELLDEMSFLYEKYAKHLMTKANVYTDEDIVKMIKLTDKIMIGSEENKENN